VGDVWGIGWSKTAFLKKRGIETALDLKNYPPDKALKHLTITGYRTVEELKGIKAIDKIEAEARQQIMVSKSFSEAVFQEEMLQNALADYTQEAVKRLREEGEIASHVSVYLMTNYMAAGPHYENGATARLASPSSYFPDILAAGSRLLHSIYRSGFRYRKVMVLLSGLEKAKGRQGGLFDDTVSDKKKERLMEAFDAINARYGRGTLCLAASRQAWGAGTGKAVACDGSLPFQMKRAYLSPAYTTRLEDVPRVR
jgi:DNA polymerase V